jgi:SAM-dependent methyltransferase
MIDYWEQRYASGGTSGKGSQGLIAYEKSATVNALLREHEITSVLDIGSGDGVVASLLQVEDYLGVDPSPTAVRLASARNPLKRFQLLDETVTPREAHLSLDVLHHLVDDEDYREHMRVLFSAHRLVIIWVASWSDAPTAAHSKHRRWQRDVPAEWSLGRSFIAVPNSFYTYIRSLSRRQKNERCS